MRLIVKAKTKAEVREILQSRNLLVREGTSISTSAVLPSGIYFIVNADAPNLEQGHSQIPGHVLEWFYTQPRIPPLPHGALILVEKDGDR